MVATDILYKTDILYNNISKLSFEIQKQDHSLFCNSYFWQMIFSSLNLNSEVFDYSVIAVARTISEYIQMRYTKVYVSHRLCYNAFNANVKCVILSNATSLIY